MQNYIWKLEENSSDCFVVDHPNLNLAQACIENACSHMFWSISDQYLDLVCHLHTQIRLMGNFGLNGGMLWITNTESMMLLALCVKEILRLHVTPDFQEYLDSLWST